MERTFKSVVFVGSIILLAIYFFVSNWLQSEYNVSAAAAENGAWDAIIAGGLAAFLMVINSLSLTSGLCAAPFAITLLFRPVVSELYSDSFSYTYQAMTALCLFGAILSYKLYRATKGY